MLNEEQAFRGVRDEPTRQQIRVLVAIRDIARQNALLHLQTRGRATENAPINATLAGGRELRISRKGNKTTLKFTRAGKTEDYEDLPAIITLGEDEWVEFSSFRGHRRHGWSAKFYHDLLVLGTHFENGKIHRTDGPSEFQRYGCGLFEWWYILGKFFREVPSSTELPQARSFLLEALRLFDGSIPDCMIPLVSPPLRIEEIRQAERAILASSELVR